eukprot:2140364-Amphidinium_carterae.1
MPSFGLPLTTLDGLQGFDHTFAVTDHSLGIAFFQGTDNDRLPAARQQEPGSFTSVPTSSKVRVATVSAGSVRPDSLHTMSHDQSRLMSRHSSRQAALVRAHEGARTPGIQGHESASQTHGSPCSSAGSVNVSKQKS